MFDGQRFVAKPLYVTADGVFSRSRPTGAEVVDLAGGYLVPPFGEGHNHNTDSEQAIERYLKAGIFYVSNPNSHPSARSTLHPRFNSPSGVDVQLAGGGLTATGGHPIFVVQRNIDRKIWTEADGEGAFYYASTPQTISRNANRGRPDFIKITAYPKPASRRTIQRSSLPRPAPPAHRRARRRRTACRGPRGNGSRFPRSGSWRRRRGTPSRLDHHQRASVLPDLDAHWLCRDAGSCARG